MYQFTQAATPFSQVFNRMEKNHLNYNHLQSKMLLPMLYNLQQTVMKQQMALKLCFAQGSQYNSLPVRGHLTFGIRQHETMQMSKGPFLFNSQRPRLMMKEKEPNEEISIKTESPVETSTSSGTLMDQYTVEHNFEGISDIIRESEIKKGTQIMRRNGFKDQSNTQSSDQENDASKLPRKSNKLITPKRPPSNAKHLWINYGRKIIEFALQQTENETQIQVKRLVGKLGSKNDFKKVFESNQTDSEDEKAFKTLFGRLALFFIRFKAASAFEDSKYKQQMIAQRDFVASWIVQLTGL